MAKDLVTRVTMYEIGDALRAKKGVTTRYKPSEMPAAIASIPEGYPEPTGTVNITQNGTQNVKDYASASVNVPNTYAAGDEGKVVSNGALISQTARAEQITENGTYDTTESNSVTVNVSGGGGDNPFALTTYIQSSGTQWIDTGYNVKSTSLFEMVLETNDTTHTYSVPFGTRATSSDNPASLSALFALSWNNGYLNAMWGSNKTSFDLRANYLNKKVVFQISAAGAKIYTEDIYSKGAPLGTTYTPTEQYSMWLFNLNDHGADYGTATRCNMKLYRFRIYEDDTLVHEFIPWKDNNDIVCLKDTVTGNLKYNAGTGMFVYGTDS